MRTKRQYIIEQILKYGMIIIIVSIMAHFYITSNETQKRKQILNFAELTELENQISTAEILQKSYNKSIDGINVNLINKKKEAKESFEKILENSNSYNHFIEKIRTKTQNLGIIIQNSNYDVPTQTANSGKYYEFKFSAIFTGEYNNMKKFLWELENAMDCLVKVSNIEIIPPMSDKQGNISMKLTISTFFLSYN